MAKATSVQKKYTQIFIRYAVLIILACIFIFPTVYLIVSSLKNNEMQIISDMSGIKAFIPYGDIGFQNYRDLFDRMDFFKFFFNSVFITGMVIAIGTVFNSMLAFVLARLEFGGKKILVTLIIALMIIPIEAIVVPLMLMVNEAGIINTFTVQIIPFIAEAFIIFLYYQTFMGLPKDLDEAAIVDGASYFRIYWQVIMPLAKPTIVTTIILNALARWGDLLWPVMVTRGPDVRPLPLAMQQLFTLEPKMWGDIFAFATLATVPILIIYIIFQKQFVQSIASSGVKG
jgi:multiple sugar transport system permease protein